MYHARSAVLAAVLAAALLLSGCGAGKPVESASPGGAASRTATSGAGAPDTFPVTVTDDLDRKVTIPARPERLVSLAPADTEVLYALGVLPKTVGVTTYDDYPADVNSIKRVGDFTSPNLEEIAALKPDVVFVTGGVQGDVVKKLEGLGAKVVAVDPPTVERLYASIHMVGKVTGTSEKAAEVVATMRAGVGAVVGKVVGEKPVSCFVEVAQGPLYTTGEGTLLADLVRLGGGANVVKELLRVDGVYEANMTFGPYDAVAIINTSDISHLGRILSQQIQPIPGVTQTVPLAIYEYASSPASESMALSLCLVSVVISLAVLFLHEKVAKKMARRG